MGFPPFLNRRGQQHRHMKLKISSRHYVHAGKGKSSQTLKPKAWRQGQPTGQQTGQVISLTNFTKTAVSSFFKATPFSITDAKYKPTPGNYQTFISG